MAVARLAAHLFLLALGVQPTQGQTRGEFFKYTSPLTGKSISLCICAKCGSTSIYFALFEAITGKEYVWVPGSFAVQSYWKWGVPGVEKTRLPGDLHVHVVRDPIDRLVSGFHSKVRCCPGSSEPCVHDSKDLYLVKHLLRLAGNQSDARCLHLDDFARIIHQIHGLHKQNALDQHFKPQHLLPCAWPTMRGKKKYISLRGTIGQVAPVLHLLVGFDFAQPRPTVDLKRHAVPRGRSGEYDLSKQSSARLCQVARIEYKALGMDNSSSTCSKYMRKKVSGATQLANSSATASVESAKEWLASTRIHPPVR